MLEKTHKWHKFCLEEELIREKRKEIYSDIISFPLMIGRKPHSIIGNKSNTLSNEFSQSSNLFGQQPLSSSHPNLALLGGSSANQSMVLFGNTNNINDMNKLSRKLNGDDELSSNYLRSTSTNSLNASSLTNSSSAINLAHGNMSNNNELRMYQLYLNENSQKSNACFQNSSNINQNIKVSNFDQNHSVDELHGNVMLSSSNIRSNSLNRKNNFNQSANINHNGNASVINSHSRNLYQNDSVNNKNNLGVLDFQDQNNQRHQHR
jgi:hypothetical protein